MYRNTDAETWLTRPVLPLLSSFMSDLRTLILTYPAIDNHAHPLLVDDSTIDFTGAISEARGDALPAAHTSLAAMRAARQLGPLYGLEEVDPEWEVLLQARKSQASEKADIRDACFQAARIQCLLLDDGLPGECESISYHDQYTISPSKRIVRVENIAEVRRVDLTPPRQLTHLY